MKRSKTAMFRKPTPGVRTGIAALALAAVTLLVLGASLPAVCAQQNQEGGKGTPQERTAESAKDEHGREERGEHDEQLKLSAEEMAEFGIELAKAGPGQMDIQISLPGEIKLNADRLAHVTPRLSGVVQDVFKNVGDTVRKGEVMAVLESRELAAAKAAYFAARERVSLAQSAYEREKKLWEDKISAEKDYLEAKQALAEVRIEARAAQQQLEALGLTAEYVQRLSNGSGSSLTRFEVTAPFDGTVIEKHIALGEALEANAEAFTLADLTTVWVDVSVYQKHLLAVRQGQEVVISAGAGMPDATGTIAYVGPIVGEQTRTAMARVLLPNSGGLWRPGLFVTVGVAVEQLTVPVVVPSTAIQIVNGETVVFVEEAGAFKAVDVQVGRADSARVEIVGGLDSGLSYVAKGGFHLKAQLEKGSFAEEGHGH